MSAVLPTDKTLVNRAGVDHSAPADMSTVKDTDLLLINRAGVDYKCTFADWKASQVSITTPTITSPSAGAVDLGDTPTFTSSAFAGTGTTHASSDWQVTKATDTAFASPVVQSMADATHKVSWDGGPLQANTDYIVRVRHNGTGGISSAWSAAVAFKTKKSFVLALSPSQLYQLKTNPLVATRLNAPVGMTHVVSNAGLTPNYSCLYTLGVDGKFYIYRDSTKAWVQDTGAKDPTYPHLPAVCYTKPAVFLAASDGAPAFVVQNDGTFLTVNTSTGNELPSVTTPPTFAPGESFVNGGIPSSAASHIFICTNKSIYFAAAYDGRVIAKELLDSGVDGGATANVYAKSTPTLPSGVHAVDVSCLLHQSSAGSNTANLGAVAVLGTDGVWYSYGVKPPSWTTVACGTRTSPTPFTIDGKAVKAVSSVLSSASYCVTDDGSLYALPGKIDNGGNAVLLSGSGNFQAVYAPYGASGIWAETKTGEWYYITMGVPITSITTSAQCTTAATKYTATKLTTQPSKLGGDPTLIRHMNTRFPSIPAPF